MNTVIMDMSCFGFTHKVSNALAEVLAEHGHVAIYAFDQMRPVLFNQADLVIFGCPTHRMNLPEEIRPLIKALPKILLKNKKVAAFDTSYRLKPWLQRFSASIKLISKMRKAGGTQVSTVESFCVQAREGPFFDGELDRAHKWAESLAAIMTESL